MKLIQHLLIFFIALTSCSSLALSKEMISQKENASMGSPEHYYNEGLTAEAQGDLLSASLALRRALILDPTLHVAQSRLDNLLKKMGLPREVSWQAPLAAFCFPEYLVIVGSVVGWSAAFVFVVLLFLRLGAAASTAKKRRWLFVVVLFFFFLGHAMAFLGTMIDPRASAQQAMMIKNQTASSSIAEGVALRNAPADTASVLQQLPPGVCVTLLSQHGFWSYVKTTAGQRGWILSSVMEPVIPPKQ